MLTRRQFAVAAILPLAFAGLGRHALAAPALSFPDLYVNNTEFSPEARALDGQIVELDGFMAPPLKAESSFFVLTKMPMAVCPFCESEADWPNDIVSIYSSDIITVAPFNVPIRVAGTLRLGVFRDEELGFVSKVRLTDATFWRL